MKSYVFLYEHVDPSKKDLASVAQWLNAKPDEIVVHIRHEPIGKFLGQIKEMYGTYSEFPKDARRTEKIMQMLKQGAPMLPIYVEEDDPDLFVMEGRHRMVAFYLIGAKTIPVAYVSKTTLTERTDDEEDHLDALKKTGFWGRRAAGCILLATDTGRIGISHRSAHVESPNTWGTVGGAIDQGEDPKKACRREISEELGFHGDVKLIPLYVFAHESGFRYYNFLAVVDHEFTPKTDWETQGFGWFEYGKWPKPLHPGLVGLLQDSTSVSTIKKYTTLISRQR